jgi:hypothetical protein
MSDYSEEMCYIGSTREFYEAGVFTTFKQACQCFWAGSRDGTSLEVIREDLAFLESKFPGIKDVSILFAWYWDGFAPEEHRKALENRLKPYEHLQTAEDDYGKTNTVFEILTGPVTHSNTLEFDLAKKLLNEFYSDIFIKIHIVDQFSRHSKNYYKLLEQLCDMIDEHEPKDRKEILDEIRRLIALYNTGGGDDCSNLNKNNCTAVTVLDWCSDD